MSIVFKIVKRIFAVIAGLVIAAVFGILLWRILSSGAPSSMKALNANGALYTAYEENGEDLYMFKQEQRSITSADGNYGYFAITDYKIIPKANQIQTVVRYNNSTLRYTAEDFDLDEVPARGDDVYDITLLLAIDLTPENENDNLGNAPESVRFIRCHGKTVLSEEKNLYNFRQLVFDFDSTGEDIAQLLDDGLILAVYADFYYCGAVDYETEPYGTLCLYDFKSENVTVKLAEKDIKALKKFGE